MHFMHGDTVLNDFEYYDLQDETVQQHKKKLLTSDLL